VERLHLEISFYDTSIYGRTVSGSDVVSGLIIIIIIIVCTLWFVHNLGEQSVQMFAR
jgi:heme/copper-type cytochrome/quinol oxidase subunit 4